MKASHQLLNSSKSVEWFTPEIYVDAVRSVLGHIDLDPASCKEANKCIEADHIFTIDDDGLRHDWFGRVFLNPPTVESTAKARNRFGASILCGSLTAATSKKRFC